MYIKTDSTKYREQFHLFFLSGRNLIPQNPYTWREIVQNAFTTDVPLYILPLLICNCISKPIWRNIQSNFIFFSLWEEFNPTTSLHVERDCTKCMHKRCTTLCTFLYIKTDLTRTVIFFLSARNFIKQLTHKCRGDCTKRMHNRWTSFPLYFVIVYQNRFDEI